MSINDDILYKIDSEIGKDKKVVELQREIERLNQEIRGLNNCIIKFHSEFCNKQAEINRLNNIINNAKIYCEDVIQEHENGDYDVDTVWLAIKEHKGNIKSVLNMLNGDLENYWRGDKE